MTNHPPQGSVAPLMHCRHCGKETESTSDIITVGGVKYDVTYCSECGIAADAFRLSQDGKSREERADSIMLRKMRRGES